MNNLSNRYGGGSNASQKSSSLRTKANDAKALPKNTCGFSRRELRALVADMLG